MKKSLLLTFVMLLSSVCLMAQNLKGGLTNVTTLKKPGAITRALTDKYPWGYYEDGEVGLMGTGKTSTYDLCIYVPGDKQFSGATLAGLEFPLMVNDTKQATVWVRNTLQGNNIYQETVKNLTYGNFNIIEFKQPVSIPAEGAYIGFTVKTAQKGAIIATKQESVPGQSFIIID